MAIYETEADNSAESGSGTEGGFLPSPAVETITSFLHQFQTTQRVLTLYPPGHRAVKPAREALYNCLRAALKMKDPLVMAIAQDRLLVDGRHMIPEGLAVDRFAEFFHRLGVAFITFESRLTQFHFDAFLDSLAGRKERFAPENLPSEEEFPGVKISLMDYGRILRDTALTDHDDGQGAGEDKLGKIWEAQIADFLMGEKDSMSEKELLNIISLIENDELFSQSVSAALGPSPSPSALMNLAGLMDSAGKFFVRKMELPEEEFLARMKKCVMSMPQEVRLQYLELPRTFPEKGETIRQMAGTLSQEELVAILASCLEVDDGSPQRLASLMELLLPDEDSKKGVLPHLKKRLEERPAQGGAISRQHWQQIEQMLTHSPEQFITESYGRQLEEISPAAGSENVLDDQDIQDMIALTDSLHADNVAEQRLWVLLEVLLLADEDPLLDSMTHDLGKVIRNHLLSSHYSLVADALLFLSEGRDSPEGGLSPEKRSRVENLLEEILGEEMIGTMIKYLKEASAQDFPVIKQLLSMVPQTSVKVLVPALAEEDNYTVRRFLVSVLIGLGHSSKGEALKMLGDSRWYVVRNMLTLLGEIGDKDCVPDIIPLIKHRELKVKREAIRALMAVDSSTAREALMPCLDDDSDEIVNMVSNYLGSTADRGTLTRIFLHRAGTFNPFGIKDNQVKGAIITLGRIKSLEAVPILERFLKKRRLLIGGKRRYDLAINAAKALAVIDSSTSLKILKWGAENGKGPVLAICRQLLGKTTEGDGRDE